MFYGFPSTREGKIDLANNYVASGETKDVVIAAVASDVDTSIYSSVVVLDTTTWSNSVHAF